jgi:DNA polymerase-3 subunit alpha
MYQDKLKRGVIKPDPRYKQMVNEEMRVFKKIGMVGFMLFMSELVSWCWENGIPVGFCRGSVGGSMIAYLTDIIDVNPLTWNTIFSRFCNENRKEIGDIDVDISPDQRELVYEHIINRFDMEHTAYILAMGTIVDKGTIDDIGRALSYRWIKGKCGELTNQTIQKYGNHIDNPYALDKVSNIKNEYSVNPEKIKKAYPDLFYYFDGLLNTVVSQSMHPAGIVVSPITLSDNYGMFWGTNTDGKDVLILPINMDEVHECGLVKYDILGLKNIQILRECCELAHIEFPLSHTMNWEDKDVWEHITDSPVGIFQFESPYAYSLLKQYQPRKINDLSLVNASLRPSGDSYRDRLIAKEINKNPSKQIDDLLADNNGFLVFQEDVIKFLRDICGLSGGEADNVRRAIGRKQVDRLQKALPQILEGYCGKSDKPRNIAEEEAKTFIQIIEDSSNYMFGYNHSTGYSMVGYLCGYMRYYYPVEFITSYLNCAKNNMEDIVSGTQLAKNLNIKINDIKFGKSIDKYSCSNGEIYKGISSIKYLNSQVAIELYELSQNNTYNNFLDLLKDINEKTSCNNRQLEILITLNFFSDFGCNDKLLKINELYNNLMSRKQIKIADMDKLGIDEELLKKYSQTQTAKMYKDLDMNGYISEAMSVINNKPLNIKKQIECECEYLGSPISTWKKAGNDYYVVIEFMTYKDKSKPYVTLYQINSGETIKTKVKDGQFYLLAPFNKYSLIKVVRFNTQKKSKLVNGKWQKTNEDEKILSEWEVF